MNEILRLRTEPCSICNETLALGISANELKPDVTGLDLFIDNHGLDDVEQPHVRLLYIDAEGVVRTISTVLKFCHVLHK
ncbi:MAG: hypothetical protein ACFFE8_06295 [Candidatus Heimdallarchaeota archaeon]